PRGVTVASMETPQGDQVERAAATTATTAAATVRRMVTCAPFVSRRRSEEGRVAEGEDPPVPGHQPVAGFVPVRRQSDDGHVEVDGARRPVEDGVPVAEDAPVGSDEPVALAGR